MSSQQISVRKLSVQFLGLIVAVWALRIVTSRFLFLFAATLAAGFDSPHGAVRQMNDFMIARGITEKKLDSTQFLGGSFIRALK